MDTSKPVKRVNLLMVDDQPGKLLSYETILAGLGLNIMRATSAREALEHLLKNEVAIVLMDVSMPEIDGFELAEMIHRHPRHQNTAIIFISAVRLTYLDRLKGYEMGAIDYIPVPVVPEILRAKVSVLADLFRKTRQLEELNQELEQRVEERTAALEASTASERVARLAAEAAIQVRDEFLSVAAHELKSSLAGLLANAQMVNRKLETDEVDASVPAWINNDLRVIDEQASRLTRLVEQLLDVSRIDQKKLSLERTPSNMAHMAQTLVDLVAARSTKHQIILTGDRELTAEIDRDSIERVLANLLDNALKCSPNGGQIEVEVRAANAGWTRISVRDHGIGIPLENRSAIFTRFYRAHAEDHGSGLGLGLFISQQLVTLHGGEISVEFPIDGGTRFVVLLPTGETMSVLAPVSQI
jgi:signal transduction histidine kinase